MNREEKLGAVLERLWEAHGRQERDEGDDLLGVLVRTVLSQSTTRSNTDRAFSNLLDRFEGDWGSVVAAPTGEVASAIEVGGLANQKAPRIQSILERAREDSPDDSYTLDFLIERSTDEALDYLESLKGVGPKTARFTMMYAAGAEVFPMDTHIFRILERLDLLDPSLSDSAAHTEAEKLIPDGEAYPAHMVLVRHGREICHARRPECSSCPVEAICPARGVENPA